MTTHSKLVLAAVLVAGASAFTPAQQQGVSTTLFNVGAGGMFDTRNPDAQDNEDARKSISAAPSFEEYLKMRDGAAAAPAPVAAAPVAAAPAYAAPAPVAAAPAPVAAGGSALEYGPYDGEMWDNETKKTVYAAWDPASPRSVNNFNPFETWEGNSPDASGFFPGEGRYKDPARPDVSYASSVIERGEIEARNANPKAGDVPGCLGCRSGAAGRAAPVAAAPAYAAPVAAVAPVAAAPAYAAPAAAAAPAVGAGGAVMDTLGSLEGPGQVWGAEGIDVGKEESDLKGYDNFGLFVQRLQSSGVAAELAGAGPFTIFAPTDTAIESYEKMFGPFDASVCKLHIVVGKVPTSQVSSATLTTIAGETLTYKRAVRKDFVNDIVIGEKTFGQYNDFPVDVECSNGLIHAISLSLAS